MILFTILQILSTKVKRLLAKLKLDQINLSTIQLISLHLKLLFGLKESKEVNQISKGLKHHLIIWLKICSLYHHILQKIIWSHCTILKKHTPLILKKYQTIHKLFVKVQSHVCIFFLLSKFESTQPDLVQDWWKLLIEQFMKIQL